MKLEKKHYVIIAVVVAIIVIWYCFFRKKAESSFDTFGSPNDPFGDENQGTPGETPAESDYIKWPSWLKIGYRRPWKGGDPNKTW